MSEEPRSAREKVSEGIRQGIGVLTAFKDALEETINEAKERGDLSPERAKQVMTETLHRAQEAAGEAKERLDLVSQKEFDAMVEAVEGLRARLDALEERLRNAPADAAGSGRGATDPTGGEESTPEDTPEP